MEELARDSESPGPEPGVLPVNVSIAPIEPVYGESSPAEMTVVSKAQHKTESGIDMVNIPLATETLSFWMTDVSAGPVMSKTSHHPFQISSSSPRHGTEALH